MLFSYNWLQTFFNKKLPKVDKLAKLIVLHSFEVDEIITKEDDVLLDIDVRPNRGSDCLCHLGIAREIASILDFDLKDKEFDLKENKSQKTKDLIDVEIKDKKDCLRYTARTITNLKIKPSPRWMKDRLKSLGLQPINNVVDSLNYVMLETGQPLHAFDADKISDQKIIVRRAKEKEKVTSFDNKEYLLDEDVLIISDPKDPLGIAGVKGGNKAGITDSTKVIIIESANFDGTLIRKGSKKINLKTDASWVFEHGLDPNLTKKAIDRSAQLIQKLAKGKIASGVIDIYPRKKSPWNINLRVKNVQSLLGIDISQKKIVDLLERGHFKVLDEKKEVIKVEIPTFRLDVKLPADLIEEIGRLYGYQKIPERFPAGDLSFPERNVNIFWKDKTKDILKELKFTEIYNYSFINQTQADLFDYKKEELVETDNPISAEYQYLRPSLIPNLLENVKEGFKNFDRFQVFELGKIFKKSREKEALAGFIAQKKDSESFYNLKGIIDVLLEKLGISNYYYDTYEATPEESKMSIWNINKSAEIRINNKEVGFIGHISERILKSLNIKGKVVMFDIDFEILQELMTEENEYQPVSPYPTAVRDLSIIVPRKVKVIEVLNVINNTGKELINDVDLFDIYEKISDEKKSLAFHIVYQSQEKTLSSDEIDKLHNKIVENLENNINWEVRK